MADAFIGEIRPFAINFVPYGWLLCDGKEYAISSYQVLYTIVGNRYGTTASNVTFKVPNLADNRALIGQGVSPQDGETYTVGKSLGQSQVALTTAQTPVHTHVFSGAVANQITTKLQTVPQAGSYLSNPAETITTPVAVGKGYLPTSGQLGGNFLAGDTLAPMFGLPQTGASAPHDNMQPTQIIVYCICALDAEYPVRP